MTTNTEGATAPDRGDAPARPDDTPPRPARTPVPLQGPIGDLDGAYRYAQALAGADILPQELRGKPANVLALLLYGQYLNIPPVIATQVISIVKGRPQLAGKFLIARVRQAGHKFEVVESTEQRCTVRITRGDDASTYEETFTLDDARNAKLITIKDGKPYARSKTGEPLPWENYPRRMLLWRAVAWCVDIACPEVKMGFSVEGEEVTGGDGPTLGQVAAERADRQTRGGRPAEPDPAADDEAVRAEVAAIEAAHTSPTDPSYVPDQLDDDKPEGDQ